MIRQQLYYSSDQSTKQYEISPTPTLARYYWTHFNSGVQNIQMIVERFREVDLPTGGHSVTSEKTSFIYWLANGHQLVTSGGLKVQFDSYGKIDVLEILTTSHDEFVPRAQLLRTATESPEMKHSPSQNKASGKKAAQQRQKQAQAIQEQVPVAVVPSSTINDQGVTPSVQQFLEVWIIEALRSGLVAYMMFPRSPKRCHSCSLCSSFQKTIPISPLPRPYVNIRPIYRIKPRWEHIKCYIMALIHRCIPNSI